MLNKVIIAGRLAKDPELRRTNDGTPVTSFKIACDRDFKNSAGERETDWVEVVAWRNAAEFAAKNFTKGRTAIVEGRLQVSNWTDKDGNSRSTVQVVSENIYFGDSKKPDSQQTAQTAKPQNNSRYQEIEEDEDLSF